MLVVAAVVIALTAFGVYRMHGIFGPELQPQDPGGSADQIVPFNPKYVVLVGFLGDPGATATITYMDINAHPQRVDNAPLPWTYEDTTTTPAVLVNVRAQGDGSSLGCRIIIDDVVKAERTVNNPSAFTYCLDEVRMNFPKIVRKLSIPIAISGWRWQRSPTPWCQRSRMSAPTTTSRRARARRRR